MCCVSPKNWCVVQVLRGGVFCESQQLVCCASPENWCAIKVLRKGVLCES